MSRRRDFVASLLAMGALRPWALHVERTAPDTTPYRSAADDRRYWVDVMARIVTPVLEHASAGRLRERMPVEASGRDRAAYSHLEALGRVLTGIAPWLELGADSTPEGAMRARFGELARHALSSVTDPRSPDYLNFTKGAQPLVDAAFLAHGIVRAPAVLWQPLDSMTKANVVRALEGTRSIHPSESNWLLFSAMIEAALHTVGAEWKMEPVDHALAQHESWYKGDGVYGDGASFHWDYYNSFVIQPMLLDVTRALTAVRQDIAARVPGIVTRARRYAAIQERMISPEGTFPPVGRSLAYRFGAFQLLGQMTLRHELPDGVTPAQVRAAMTAVIRRMIEAPGTFDADGWLTIGFVGHQPAIGEGYISTGSLYLCTAGLIALGLPASDEFWAVEARDWTSRRAWGGENLRADHAI